MTNGPTRPAGPDTCRISSTHISGHANDVGLLAKEYDPKAKRQLGNFPQAFSHLALINSARNLASVHGSAHNRAGGSAATADRPMANKNEIVLVTRRSGFVESAGRCVGRSTTA